MHGKNFAMQGHRALYDSSCSLLPLLRRQPAVTSLNHWKRWPSRHGNMRNPQKPQFQAGSGCPRCFLHTAVVSQLAEVPTKKKAVLDLPKELTHSPHSALIDSAKLKANLEAQEQFALALKEFMVREKYRRGHVNFITLALHRMDEFGLEKNLLTYNRLLDLFPKGRFVARRMLDAFWPRSLPQTELALEILTKMEEQGVRPDYTTYSLLVEIFGKTSLPVDKCYRIAYWFDKYENADPYRIKGELPAYPLDLARLVLQRVVGEEGQITVHKVSSDGVEDDHMVSAHTRAQLSLLQSLAGLQGELLLVEGPHRIWLRKTQQFYYSLRRSASRESLEDEGAVLGVCMCQVGTRENLTVWLRALQEVYPALAEATLVYNIQEYQDWTDGYTQLQDISRTSIPESAASSSR